MDEPRARTGLGFFPEAVVIRDTRGPVDDLRVWHDDDEFVAAGPSRPPPYLQQGKDSWELWKDWNTNQSGHAGKKGPPVFVPATLQYDELGRGMADGFGVDVEEGKVKRRPTGRVADWYRSLASRAPTPATPPEPPDQATSSTKLPSQPDSDTTPAREDSQQPASPSEPASRNKSPPPPIRVHRPEWFIRRALVNPTSASAPPTRAPTPSSIGSMLSLNPTARPPPRPHYTIGPGNAGYARLEALGWGGGGLGKPEGEASAGPSKRARAKSVETGPVVDVDGVVDLTGDTSESEEETDIPHGPGRVVPVATVLKLDRLGLGRGHAEKKVTHTQAEIQAAQRRKRGRTENQKKVNWKEKDKRDRESRRRIAAALNA